MTHPSRPVPPRRVLALLLAILLPLSGAVLLAPPASATPAISLSPLSGAPGASVKVSGSGFPKRTAGGVTFDGTKVLSFYTTRTGTFSASFTVPEGAARSVTVRAATPYHAATAPFTVTSSPSPSPSPSPTTSGLAPRQVLAVQGPTGGALYAVVTWDRSDAAAVGYEVSRDGAVIGSTQISGDAWDDLSLRDTTVTAGRGFDYRVRARFADGSLSAWSSPSRLTVRSDAQTGSGRVFTVDSYSGTDRQRLQAAVDAAVAAGGGVVSLAARTYSLDAPVEVTAADNVVIRGSGRDQTFVQPAYAGETTTCGDGGRLIGFMGSHTTLAAKLTAPVAVGDRVLKVSSTSEFVVGRRIMLYEPSSSTGSSPADYEAAGVAQDPGTGTDHRHRWDASEVVAVDAASSTVTLRDALSQSFTTAVPLVWISKGNNNGIERLTVQGRSSSETTFYRLVDINRQAGFRMADVQGRWANRNLARVSGYDVQVVDFRGPLGDPGGTDGTCKYKFSVTRAANFTFVGGVMGEPTHARNTSFITTQRAQRSLVRASTFYGNDTYAFNEHGGGSRHWVFENNYVAVGPTAKAGVFLGNSSFGFAGAGIIRNNTFNGNHRDVSMQENTYEVRVLDNVMRNTVDRVITGYGWGASFTDPSLRGSIRWTISRNRIEGAQRDGIVLGEATSTWYPYPGVRDVVISDNALGVAGTAIALHGTSTDTNRLQVSGNTGTNRYLRPSLTAGSYWAGNADGVSYGSPTAVSWTKPHFP